MRPHWLCIFARIAVSAGIGFFAVGLLRTSEDSWIYAHVSGSIFVAVLAVMYLVLALFAPVRRRRRP